MKKILYTIFLIGGTCLTLHAQQPARYAQYHLNPVLINPAATGFNQNHNLLFNFRNSWAGFPGAPKDITFSYDGMPVERVGLGALIYSQRIGHLQNYRAQLSYAYRFNIGEFKTSVGLSTEYLQSKLLNDVFLDPLTALDDPLIEEAADGLQFFDATLGFYGEYMEKFFVGLTLPNLVYARIDQATVPSVVDNDPFRQFTFMLGYRFKAADEAIRVEPSLLMRRLRNAPFQTDINLKLSFLDEQLIGGLVYSVGGASKAGFLIGTRLNNFLIAYSYDVGLIDFQSYNNGGHEITVGIRINPKPSRVKIE